MPDKPAAFREIARVLKPGGRLAVSDIALKQPLPPELGQDMMAYVGCIAGAILIEEYRQHLLEAGFAHVEVVETGADLNAYAKIENQASCCSPAPAKGSLAVVESCCCCGTDVEHARVARTDGRPAAAVQRERLCRQRADLRRQAGSRINGP